MKIAYGNSRMDKRWKNKDISWDALEDTVRTTRRTTETVAEFRKMSKAQQDAIKDIGGFATSKRLKPAPMLWPAISSRFW